MVKNAIDNTPNSDYPIRILKEYSKQCDVLKKSITTFSKESNLVKDYLIKAHEENEERKISIEYAINILEKVLCLEGVGL